MKERLVDGSVVEQMCALQPDGMPQGPRASNPDNSPADFDPNIYFSVLTHLKMQEGYMLDYVYHEIKGFGGFPRLYARRADGEPLETFEQYDERKREIRPRDHLVSDETSDSFFQLKVFECLAEQFYLHWHANYDDRMIITSRQEVEAMIAMLDREAFGASLTESQTSAIRGIDPMPFVVWDDFEVAVTYCLFTRWGGFYRMKDTFFRYPPYPTVGVSDLERVEYNCGVCY